MTNHLQRYNNQGSLMKIVEYYGCHNIIVEFQDEWKYRTNAQLTQFYDGRIKNPYHPTVFGIGIIGELKHTIDKSKKINCKEFNTWYEMLRRCYDIKYKNRENTYNDVICCKEWLYYPNFYNWIINQENYKIWVKTKLSSLDKDILHKGNKIYSPENCLLVPHFVNSLFVRMDKNRGNYPIGISYDKKSGRFSANVSRMKNGKYRCKNFGKYPTAEEAFYLGYKPIKESYIKEIAKEEFEKGTISKICFEAMMNYKVEITD